MKRVDRLVVGEVLGPWLFGVAIFTVLIMAGSFLFKLTDYVVRGIPMTTVIELTFLLLPGIMAKTFPMAVLLATLLAFGRLSGDSEIVALRAAGTSVGRIMVPVAVFGLGVSVLAFGFNELLVPPAAKRATALQQDLAKKLDASSLRPTSYPIYDQDKLLAQVVARDFSISQRSLTGVSVVVYDKDGKPKYHLDAPKLVFELVNGKFDLERSWRLTGGSTLISADGQQMVRFEKDVWPAQVPRLDVTVDNVVAAQVKDLDTFSMRETALEIAKARKAKQNPRQIKNLEYGYWNKVALPLAALIYALVGAPLGIRNHRAGTATGFWLSVVIIFGYMLLANLLAISAQGGAIPSWLASFAPLLIGFVVAVIAIHRKNG